MFLCRFSEYAYSNVCTVRVTGCRSLIHVSNSEVISAVGRLCFVGGQDVTFLGRRFGCELRVVLVYALWDSSAMPRSSKSVSNSEFVKCGSRMTVFGGTRRRASSETRILVIVQIRIQSAFSRISENV